MRNTHTKKSRREVLLLSGVLSSSTDCGLSVSYRPSDIPRDKYTKISLKPWWRDRIRPFTYSHLPYTRQLKVSTTESNSIRLDRSIFVHNFLTWLYSKIQTILGHCLDLFLEMTQLCCCMILKGVHWLLYTLHQERSHNLWLTRLDRLYQNN